MTPLWFSRRSRVSRLMLSGRSAQFYYISSCALFLLATLFFSNPEKSQSPVFNIFVATNYFHTIMGGNLRKKYEPYETMAAHEGEGGARFNPGHHNIRHQISITLPYVALLLVGFMTAVLFWLYCSVGAILDFCTLAMSCERPALQYMLGQGPACRLAFWVLRACDCESEGCVQCACYHGIYPKIDGYLLQPPRRANNHLAACNDLPGVVKRRQLHRDRAGVCFVVGSGARSAAISTALILNCMQPQHHHVYGPHDVEACFPSRVPSLDS